jgi:RimJ/RimL family protein N-acetyltransferase
LVESGNIIGTISLKINDKNDETATTGTMIGKEYTNHGYGTEAKHLLLAYVFDHLFLRKIYSEVFSYNPTSKAYSLKCGYVHEATLIKDKFFEGKYWDKWILSITKKQWFPVWETYKAKNQP